MPKLRVLLVLPIIHIMNIYNAEVLCHYGVLTQLEGDMYGLWEAIYNYYVIHVGDLLVNVKL